MKTTELKQILKDHLRWLNNEGGKRADLRGADLQGAYLRGADLQGADLQGAYLQGADLQDAYLRGAYLRGAYLQGAYLQGADLQDADLQGADLQDAGLPDYKLCDGDLIVWKKGRTKDGFCLIKLLIPKEAKRTASLVGRKCRAEYADVLEITGVDECDCWNDDFKLKYKVGERVYPDKYDDDPRVECTSGIHFFLTRKEAEEF